jgi:hypothetical protein
MRLAFATASPCGGLRRFPQIGGGGGSPWTKQDYLPNSLSSGVAGKQSGDCVT